MRLGGNASYAVGVQSRAEVEIAYNWALDHHLPCLMIGSGSNIVWQDSGFTGLLIVNQIKGFTIVEQGHDEVYVTVGAGESWDEVVARCVAAGLTGVEALSLIPGTAGATPVQNVGAYGQEIANVLLSVQAFDVRNNTYINIRAEDCAFGYRTSRFKTTDRGRFLITSITLRLTKGNPRPPFYPALEKYATDHNITDFTPQVVREAVIDIRSSKLPNPNKVANNGSFFANPYVSEAAYATLASDYPDMPHWPNDEGYVKLSAAWLLDQAGFRDFHDTDTGMATWPAQTLVMVNEKATSTASLLKFKQKLVDAVKAKFGVTLEQEPELLPHQ
jgi:UDP-N-acetylmuramate dehydrogenase